MSDAVLTERLASAEQRAAIDYVDGHAFVGAGPGTGKTFLLIERVRALLALGVPSQRILVLTFSRRAVAELRERLRAAEIADSSLEVRTFHGFAARVLGGGVDSMRDNNSTWKSSCYRVARSKLTVILSRTS